MPHDLHGEPLKVGDVVLVPCVVTSVTASEEFCNVGVETLYPMFPGDHKSSGSFNAKQVVKPPRNITDALLKP